MPMPLDVSQPVFLALLGIFSSNKRGDQPPDTPPALTIAGTAATTVAPTEFYAFTPTVYQGGERKLTFSILNKPAWASFGKRRGTLYGSPSASHAGSYSNIIITVSDGRSTVELAPFAIQVPSQSASLAAKNLPTK